MNSTNQDIISILFTVAFEARFGNDSFHTMWKLSGFSQELWVSMVLAIVKQECAFDSLDALEAAKVFIGTHHPHRTRSRDAWSVSGAIARAERLCDELEKRYADEAAEMATFDRE